MAPSNLTQAMKRHVKPLALPANVINFDIVSFLAVSKQTGGTTGNYVPRNTYSDAHQVYIICGGSQDCKHLRAMPQCHIFFCRISGSMPLPTLRCQTQCWSLALKCYILHVSAGLFSDPCDPGVTENFNDQGITKGCHLGYYGQHEWWKPNQDMQLLPRFQFLKLGLLLLKNFLCFCKLNMSINFL